MRSSELISILLTIEKFGAVVLTVRDFEKFFPQDSNKTMEKSLQRMVKEGLLIKAARGVYINALAINRHPRIIEEIALALRPGKLSFVSLESVLSEYGIISQLPIDRLTVMTTGAKGIHETPFGIIEFTHTKRSIPNILDRTIFIKERPLRIAKKQAAIADLLRVGRNTNMINYEDMDEEMT